MRNKLRDSNAAPAKPYGGSERYIRVAVQASKADGLHDPASCPGRRGSFDSACQIIRLFVGWELERPAKPWKSMEYGGGVTATSLGKPRLTRAIAGRTPGWY